MMKISRTRHSTPTVRVTLDRADVEQALAAYAQTSDPSLGKLVPGSLNASIWCDDPCVEVELKELQIDLEADAAYRKAEE